MTKLYNKNRDSNIPITAVYIGRPSKWGNPFVVGKDGSRSEVIKKYHLIVLSNLKFIKEIKSELKGKDLICHCSPLPCHGDILLQIANN